MQKEGTFEQIDESNRLASEALSSFLHCSKKDDVVYFRIETPSQLEKEYDFGPVLGEGTFGVVFRGVRKKDKAKCAIKKIMRERSFSASERARLNREISILRLVRHPGIIQLFAVAESPTILFLITELCEGNTLSGCLDALPEQTGLEEYVVAEITRQVTSALSYLHNRGIIHRDLKAGNIMFLHKVELEFRKLQSSGSCQKSFEKESTPNTQLCPVANVSNGPIITEVQVTMNDVNGPKLQNRRGTKAKIPKGTSKIPAPCVSAGTRSADKPRKQFSNLYNSSKSANVLSRETVQSLPPNKLPPASLVTKLIDFGLAIEVRKNEEALDSPCGTPLYMAPEVLAGRSYTRQCDVWSLGILIFQLLTRNFPFMAQNEEELVEQVSSFDLAKVLQSFSMISPLAQNCLTHALHIDPAYRYSANELLLDPWVSQYTIMNQDDIMLESYKVKQHSTDAHTDGSARASSSMIIMDSNLSKRGNSFNSQPSSLRFMPPGSTPSTTNVLELMKQYHKELTGHKQNGVDEPGNIK